MEYMQHLIFNRMARGFTVDAAVIAHRIRSLVSPRHDHMHRVLAHHNTVEA